MDDETTSTDVAYAMQEAYRSTRNKLDALIAVANKHPEVSYTILGPMWDAIDAYVDMNE